MTSESKYRTFPGQDQSKATLRQEKVYRAKRLRVARDLAGQLHVTPDGRRMFQRFSTAQRIEHQVLIITFTLLAFTGLIQRYAEVGPVAFSINNLLGGIDSVRAIHRLAAIIFVIEAIYHTWIILVQWFVKHDLGTMWPTLGDARDAAQIVKYNLGLAKSRPRYGRFSFDEKIEYYALVWGSIVMIITGIVQWFPLLATRLLPGQAVAISRAIHSWEALLATLAILTWHMYHTVIKHRNTSIFTGMMSEEEMLEDHAAEYERIMAASTYLEHLEENQNTTTAETSTDADEEELEPSQTAQRDQ